jgi:hypothetical protein
MPFMLLLRAAMRVFFTVVTQEFCFSSETRPWRFMLYFCFDVWLACWRVLDVGAVFGW